MDTPFCTMSEKKLPFTPQQLDSILREHPTPVYIYDEQGIRESARRLNDAFSWVPGGFKNYFAIKATPNPSIVDILREEGSGADCSSMPELVIAERLGISGENVMFTSNNTPAEEFRQARQMGAIINLDDLTFIEFLERSAGLPELICFRYTPSNADNPTIGKKRQSKFGLRDDQIFEAYRIAKQKRVTGFGLHTMTGSNVLSPDYFAENANTIFRSAVEISRKERIEFEFINLGGGIGIPYRPTDIAVDLGFVSRGIQEVYEKTLVQKGFDPKKIF